MRAKTSSVHALNRTTFLWFSRQNVGGMVGESEFNMCTESVKLFQVFRSLGEAHSRGYLKQEQSENALVEMKAAVNLCQQCQGWGGCSLQSREEHVFIIICRPSAEKWIFYNSGAFPHSRPELQFSRRFIQVNCYRFSFKDLLTFIAGISNSFL